MMAGTSPCVDMQQCVDMHCLQQQQLLPAVLFWVLRCTVRYCFCSTSVANCITGVINELACQLSSAACLQPPVVIK